MRLKTSKEAPSKRSITNRFRGYGVGYRHPPKAHQFKPGQSGNPKGRRKGTKNAATLVREILTRKIRIRDQGKIRDVPTIEAMLLKFAERALNGDPKAAAFLLNWFVEVEQKENRSHIEQVRMITDDMTAQEASELWAASLRENRLPEVYR
jgi:hypothetical protein